MNQRIGFKLSITLFLNNKINTKLKYNDSIEI